MLGSIFAFGLVRRGGLAAWFGVGIALFGAPLALIGVVPEQAAAILLLGLVGIGNALIDVGGFTLLARLADETVLARMFAGFEAILTLGVAAGGLVTPLVVELLGVRLALVAIGLLAPLAVAASWPALRRLDARDARARRGHRDPARGAHAGRAAGGDDRAARRRARARRVRAAGRRCSSRASAATASTSSSPVGPRWSATDASSATLGRGDCFGEIALLRDRAADGHRSRLRGRARCA